MFCWKFAVLGSVREILRYPIGNFFFFFFFVISFLGFCMLDCLDDQNSMFWCCRLWKKVVFSEVGFWCWCWELAEQVDAEWERKKVRWGWIIWIVCVASILCLRSGYLHHFQSPFFIFYFFNVLIYFSSIWIRRLAKFLFKKKKNWKRHMIYLGMWQLL